MLLRYRPHGLTDAALFHVYQRMLADGDFEHRFGIGMEMLSGFYGTLQEPAAAYYARAGDEGPIWALFWLQPMTMGATHFSVWIAPEVRATKRTVVAILDALGAALDPVTGMPVVIVTTNQERLLSTYRRFGFACCGTIPELLGKHGPTHVWYLTRDAYAATRARYERLLKAA